MIRTTILALLAAAVLAAAATAGNPDPRKCSFHGIKGSAAACGNHSAVVAIKARFAKMASHPDPVSLCKDATETNLRWTCKISDDQGHRWTAVVTFKALSSGWHTYVNLARVP